MPGRFAQLLLIAAFSLAAPHVEAAGLQLFEIPADGGLPLKGIIWTPCAAPAAEAAFDGGIVLSGVKDCAIAGNRLPLIVVSHGRRASSLSHIDTATALADAGFVVAAINHPGDTSQDFSRTDEFSVLVERPADMKRLTDFMLGTWKDAAVLDPRRVGLFGFSRGAYTGLMVIGGNPDYGVMVPLCQQAAAVAAKCLAIREGRMPTAPPVHDPRVKAAILADPPLVEGLFNREGVAGVTIPLLLWRSEFGGDGATPNTIDALEKLLPVRPDYRTASNSQHFSFIAPCPPAFAKAAPALCTDPPGFDRVAFHRELNDAAVAFFRKHLGTTP
ncbi:dienelactone hydrolase [Bradyrhizobium jicamae]|uniref:alpha/beta hydrolase family protein n=1 Tax=Bradyrhizobium jicamae TaxID=280332 RepID=UPI001BADE24F|nr:dienelactone hydrolase [Bradyrhizobium jicamae]MBR0753951.1 dienelactone hydrolase [Bradyrhizobium jicamae]